MIEELKACPLCGGASEIYQDDGSEQLYRGRCTQCWAKTDGYPSKEQVAAEWERRAKILSEAKACPFCGGKAKFYPSIAYERNVWKVMCGVRVDCGALLNDFDTLEEAVKAWNKRAGTLPSNLMTLVQVMREQQKRYESTRSADARRESERYEQEVDQVIKEFYTRQSPIFTGKEEKS